MDKYSSDMKEEIIKIMLGWIEHNEPIETTADKLLDLFDVSGSLRPDLTLMELHNEFMKRFKSLIELGKLFGEYFDDDEEKRYYFEDWMSDLEEQYDWFNKQ